MGISISSVSLLSFIVVVVCRHEWPNMDTKESHRRPELL